MSHLMIARSQARNPAVLACALQRMGFSSEQVSISYDENLIGVTFAGQNIVDCVVLVKKREFRGYGDFAAKKAEDGTLELHLDDMDNVGALKNYSITSGASLVPGQKFTERLLQWYAALEAEGAMLQEGLSPEITEETDGQLRVMASY